MREADGGRAHADFKRSAQKALTGALQLHDKCRSRPAILRTESNPQHTTMNPQKPAHANMKKTTLLLAAICGAIVCTITLDSRAVDKPEAAKPTTKVMSVEKVTLTPEGKGNQLKVEAQGMVNSGGWSGIALVPSKDAPKDGRAHLDFVGVKPDGMATMALVNVSASTIIEAPEGKVTVVVHAKGKSAEESITLKAK